MTITVLDSQGVERTLETPLAAGRSAAATSKPVALSTEDKAAVDAVNTVLGVKGDAKSTATDTTAISAMSVWKQISASVQALAAGIVLGAGTALIGKVKEKFIEAVAATMTRPNNTTAYSALQAIANNTAAGSVTPLSFTVSDVNDDLVTIERARVITTDTGFQGKAVRLHMFRASPTPGAGDGAAFTVPRSTFIGTLSGTLGTFSDGAGGILVPDQGSRIITLPTSGARTVFGLLQALEASGTTVAQSTWIVTLEGFQGGA